SLRSRRYRSSRFMPATFPDRVPALATGSRLSRFLPARTVQRKMVQKALFTLDDILTCGANELTVACSSLGND
ncbi:hypothetical protein, partial [Geminicoccus flavidas]|uniref:hypothetical protein n=1 Tax=Geminicoccus flavidas TaxID=2506407 RepID=UPI001F386D8B